MGDSEGVYNGKCVFLGMRNTMAFTISLKLRRQGNKVTLPCLSPSRLRFWSLSYHEKKKQKAQGKGGKTKKKITPILANFFGRAGGVDLLKAEPKGIYSKSDECHDSHCLVTLPGTDSDYIDNLSFQGISRKSVLYVKFISRNVLWERVQIRSVKLAEKKLMLCSLPCLSKIQLTSNVGKLGDT